MLKDINNIEIGDWVVLESVLLSRFCDRPWKVTSISKGRIYLESYVRDEKTNEVEVRERRYVMRKSVKLVFTSEQSATVVAEKARELSELYEKQLRQLGAEHKARVKEYIDSIPRMAE